MLLQSHEGYLAPLAALPDVWSDGEYSGLCGRGGYTVSAKWRGGKAYEFTVKASCGGICRVKYGDMSRAVVECGGEAIAVTHERFDLISFECRAGEVYTITKMERPDRAPTPECVMLGEDNRTISWKPVEGYVYTISRAYDNEPTYKVIASGLASGEYTDADDCKFDHVTYRVTAKAKDAVSPASESLPAVCVGNNATKLYLERYRHIIRQLDSLK